MVEVATIERLDSIPGELRERRQWVVWRTEERDDKATKVPYRADRPSARASTTDPASWSTFDAAVGASAQADGIGFVFSADDPYVGVDLDELGPDALAIVRELASYTERSPSGRGVHVIVRADLNGHPRRRRGAVEVYADRRYFAMTGKRVRGAPGTVEARQAELERVLARVFPPEPEHAATPRPLPAISATDENVLELALGARNGTTFRALWEGATNGHGSHSEADLALCGMLAFWCGPDPSRIDGLFRRSGLMRSKWDTRRGEATYGELTVGRALEGRTEFYEGDRRMRTPSRPAPQPKAAAQVRSPAMSDEPVVEISRTAGGDSEPLPLVGLAAFVAREDEAAREPLVGRPERSLLPRGGLAVVGGVGGSAKTTFTIDAVAHFASATPWRELELGRALRVAMIDVEGPREPLRQKLEHKLDVWEGDPFADNVLVLDGEPWGDFSFADPDDRCQLRQACSLLAVDLVVCNPLGRLGMTGGGTPEEVGTFVGWLRECGLWADVAFWLIHHFNRGVHHDVLMRLSGAWDRDADTIIGLARDGERKTKLTWAKFRWALDGGPTERVEVLEWDIPTLSFRSVSKPETAAVSPDEVRRRVLEALETDDEWRSSSWVRDAAVGANEAVDQALRDLFESGSIRLSVAAPGKEIESVADEQWGDWRRLRTRKYWRANSHAPQQSPLPLAATDGDSAVAPQQEGGSRRVAPPPKGRGDGTATANRGQPEASHAGGSQPAPSSDFSKRPANPAHATTGGPK